MAILPDAAFKEREAYGIFFCDVMYGKKFHTVIAAMVTGQSHVCRAEEDT